MIPKRIFYVWLGGNKTNLANACIEAWYQMLPDWEIIEINEKSKIYFNYAKEIANNLWFKTVCDLRIWAYASEYIRCKVLFDNGGIYLDSDVSLIKDLQPFLRHKLFLYGSYATDNIDAAVLGSEKNHEILGDMLSFYNEEVWKSPNYTIPSIITGIVKTRYNLEANKNEIRSNDSICIYPYRYFCPHYYGENFTRAHITPDTHSIHWHEGSWMNRRSLFFLSQKHRLPLAVLLRQLSFIENVDKNAEKRISHAEAKEKAEKGQ